jgi:hypothetical protein
MDCPHKDIIDKKISSASAIKPIEKTHPYSPQALFKPKGGK